MITPKVTRASGTCSVTDPRSVSANAKQLAHGLNGISGLAVDPNHIHTNIVYFSITRPDLTAADLAERLNASGVRVLPTGPQQLRAVTQYHVSASDIDIVLSRVEKTMASVEL